MIITIDFSNISVSFRVDTLHPYYLPDPIVTLYKYFRENAIQSKIKFFHCIPSDQENAVYIMGYSATLYLFQPPQSTSLKTLPA